MEKSATTHSEKSATKFTAKRQYKSLATCDSLIKHPVVFCLAAYRAGSVRTMRSYNPAKAYTLAMGVVRDNYPVSITLWLQVGADYMMPLFYVATSERDLDNAFKSIAFDMANADKIYKGEHYANKTGIQEVHAGVQSAETHD